MRGRARLESWLIVLASAGAERLTRVVRELSWAITVSSRAAGVMGSTTVAHSSGGSDDVEDASIASTDGADGASCASEVAGLSAAGSACSSCALAASICCRISAYSASWRARHSENFRNASSRSALAAVLLS